MRPSALFTRVSALQTKLEYGWSLAERPVGATRRNRESPPALQITPKILHKPLGVRKCPSIRNYNTLFLLTPFTPRVLVTRV
jgi:hypothetical protein